jgi:hypothetical protein
MCNESNEFNKFVYKNTSVYSAQCVLVSFQSVEDPLLSFLSFFLGIIVALTVITRIS